MGVKAGAIVLAAGASRRMGRQKVLLPFAGSTVIEHIVGELRAGGVTDVVVVTGKDPDRVEAQLANANVRFAHNADFESGMLSSVRVGLQSVGDNWDGVCIALGDQPSIRGETVKMLLDAFDGTSIVRPTFDGRGGHPIVIGRGYFDEVLTDFDDVGLRGLFDRRRDSVVSVPIGHEGVLRDMDYPEDYVRELQIWEEEAG